MLKRAYQVGVQLALKEAGLEKAGFQSIEDMKRQAIKGPSAGGPSMLSGAWQAGKTQLLSPPKPAVSAPMPKPPVPPPMPKITSPQTQMGMRRSNIESKQQRLRRL